MLPLTIHYLYSDTHSLHGNIQRRHDQDLTRDPMITSSVLATMPI